MKDWRQFHLAGIIPVAHPPLDFNCPWHDCLMPLDKDYLAIERSVLECATAGCETIWIVAHKGTTPLVRYRIGEAVEDPVWINRKYDTFRSRSRRRIPIYYVPIHPKDRLRRDGMVWSTLYGAKTAFDTSAPISNYVRPDRYFVSFPYGVYNSRFVRPHRRDISNVEKSFYVSHKGKTVRDGEYLAFTFDNDELKQMFKIFRDKATGYWDPKALEGDFLSSPKKPLPLKERFSGITMSFQDVFGQLNPEYINELEIDWYHNIGTWEGYRKYLASDDLLKKPKFDYVKYREWKGVGIEEV